MVRASVRMFACVRAWLRESGGERAPSAAAHSSFSFLQTTAGFIRMSTDAAGNKLCSVDFEIFGNVQGVCFRMYTEKEGLRLGLCGWVKNTNQDTVIGQVQGPADKIQEMKVWLSKKGSPSCRITNASFTNERTIDKLELSGFKTRH